MIKIDLDKLGALYEKVFPQGLTFKQVIVFVCVVGGFAILFYQAAHYAPLAAMLLENPLLSEVGGIFIGVLLTWLAFSGRMSRCEAECRELRANLEKRVSRLAKLDAATMRELPVALMQQGIDDDRKVAILDRVDRARHAVTEHKRPFEPREHGAESGVKRRAGETTA